MHQKAAMRRLSSLLFCALCLLTVGPALAAQPLLTPAQLQPLLAAGAVRVVDVREAPAYALQHLPGAVSAPYGLWRGPAENPGVTPALPALTALVQQLGLTPQTHAVIVYTGTDSTDFGSAARVYWTLKSLGLQQLSILNGGLSAWKAAGLPVSDQAAAAQPSHWQPRFSTQWLSTRESLANRLGNGKLRLIDARPAVYFDGRNVHEAARARGTLPGAHNLDSDFFFEPGSSALMSQADLQSEADSIDTSGGDTVSFCNTGHWAATDWFVLSEVLGQPNVRLYAGSIVDWTQAPQALPMQGEAGRWEQLRQQVLGWSHRNLGTRAP